MGNFITGVLEKNEAGASYEGIVYDRSLMLRHQTGQVTEIFDPLEPISTSMQVGKIYEVVLVATTLASVQYASVSQSVPQGSAWHGIVVDSAWKVPEDTYHNTRPEVYEREWILLETPLGQILIDPHEIGTTVSRNGSIYWKDSRQDLYVVV